jgi:hypothetical protein
MVLPGGEAVILTLALMLGVAFSCTGAAMLYAWTLWPLLPMAFCGLMGLTLFCCGLLHDAIDDMPEFLVDHGDESVERCIAFKWFLFGLLFMASMLCSWMLGRSGALSMPMAWVTSIGSWAATAVMCLAGSLSIRAKRASEKRGGMP